jgi:hypothetical protein
MSFSFVCCACCRHVTGWHSLWMSLFWIRALHVREHECHFSFPASCNIRTGTFSTSLECALRPGILCRSSLLPEYISGVICLLNRLQVFPVCWSHCRNSLFAEHTTGVPCFLNTFQELSVCSIDCRCSLFADHSAVTPCFLNTLQEFPVSWKYCRSVLIPECTAEIPCLLNILQEYPVFWLHCRSIQFTEYIAGVPRIKKDPVYLNSFLELHRDIPPCGTIRKQSKSVMFTGKIPKDSERVNEYYIFWKVQECYFSWNIIQEWRRPSLEENNEWPCI